MRRDTLRDERQSVPTAGAKQGEANGEHHPCRVATGPVEDFGVIGGRRVVWRRARAGTVPVGAIAELVKGDVFYWGQLMAAARLGSVPVAIICSFFVEHYVAGLTTGAVRQ
jgi:ABC-type maltose transport system permease subunit